MKFKLLNVLLFFAVPFCVSGMSKDTSCAVVLYSGAKYSMEAKFINFAVRKAYHKKIQILADEGLKYSFVDIPYHRFMEYTETVGGIQISVTDADGGNIRVMDNGFVRDIDIDGNYKRKQFTVPDVHLGDIIDIRYEIVGVFPQYYEKQVDSTSNFDDFGFTIIKTYCWY